MTKGHRIDGIVPGSIAEELELQPGDYIVTVNGNPVEDVLDYRFFCKEEYLEVLIRRGDEEAVFEIEKDSEEDLGLVFDNGLMDEYHRCRNKCVFCFIDQMPSGMRPTLYFKDDDERLSFLQGNYITLTNLKESDIERIIKYRLSPINISVHTMDAELRCRMLRNRFAGVALSVIDRFYEAGIVMNGQIVLCEGINDGKALEYTIEKLGRYCPVMESVSVVPVGLTKHRDGLEQLLPITPDNAARTIDIIEKYQKYFYEKHGLHFIHASDEMYLLAERPLPEAGRYDGYLQIENGVGMLTCLGDEFDAALCEEAEGRYRKDSDRAAVKGSYVIATGVLAAGFISELIKRFHRLFSGVKAEVKPIINRFFGESITVAGLVTGSDLIKGLMEMPGVGGADAVLIPLCMLRSGEDVFLDDVTVSDVEKALGTRVIPVQNDGYALLSALIGEPAASGFYRQYESRDP